MATSLTVLLLCSVNAAAQQHRLTQEELTAMFQEFADHLTIAQRVARLELRVQEIGRNVAALAAMPRYPVLAGSEFTEAPKTNPARAQHRRSQLHQRGPNDETGAAELNAHYLAISPRSAK